MYKSSEYFVGSAVIIGIAAFVYLSINIADFRSDEEVFVTAVFEDINGVSVGSDVVLSGVKVGSIRSITVEEGKAHALLSLVASLDAPVDSLIEIRARSLLGEKFVEIKDSRSDAPKIKHGDVLTNTDGFVDLDQIMSKLLPLVEAIDPADVRGIVHELMIGAGSMNQIFGGHEDSFARIIDNLAALDIPDPGDWPLDDIFAKTNRSLGYSKSLLREIDERAPRLVEQNYRVMNAVADVSEPMPLIVSSARESLTKMLVILSHLEQVDGPAIRRFAQQEGVLGHVGSLTGNPSLPPFLDADNGE